MRLLDESKDQLPEDLMVILVKNHKQRDESIRYRKENARRILKEKQRKAQEEADRKRFYRMKGMPLPEEANFDKEVKATAEAHLMNQKKKREESESREQLSKW